MNKKTFF